MTPLTDEAFALMAKALVDTFSSDDAPAAASFPRRETTASGTPKRPRARRSSATAPAPATR